MFRRLSDNVRATIDLTTVLTIGIAFAGLMVIGYIIFTVQNQLIPNKAWETGGNLTDARNASWNSSYANANASLQNITGGFDNAVNFLLIAITIFILAIAIAALLMLRARRQ